MGFLRSLYSKDRKLIVSRQQKENHVAVVIKVANKDSGEEILNELKKTIHKMNRFLEKGLSFEILLIQQGLNNQQEE